MVRFIHFSDTHLGLKMDNKSLGTYNCEERRRSIWNTVKRVVEYAKDNNIDFLLIPGDIYEKEYFTIGDGNRLKEIFSMAEGIEIFIVAGNHDYISKNSIYSQIKWPENVHTFGSNGIEKIEIEDKDTAVFGYSWDNIEIKDELILKAEDFSTTCKNKILLLHTDVDKNSKYLPVDLENIESFGIDYVALGHIHKHEFINDKIAYSGCLEPTHFKELGKKGFIEGYLEDSKLEAKFVAFSEREFIIKKININEGLGYEDIILMIKNEIEETSRSKDFYRLELSGYYQNDIDKEDLIKDIKNLFYYVEITDKIMPDYDLNKLEEEYEDGIVGYFIKDMKSKDINDPVVKEALYIGLNALLKR